MKATCSKCGETFEQTDNRRRCKSCRAAYARAWRAKHLERVLEESRQKYVRLRQDPNWVEQERKRGREYWQQLRHEAIMAYGGYVCACCGETEPIFLTLDHVNNDGAEHRRSLGYRKSNGQGASSRTLSWLKQNGYPPGFQVLCSNCNTGKARNGGICPHQLSRKANRVNSRNVSQEITPSRAPQWEGVETIQ